MDTLTKSTQEEFEETDTNRPKKNTFHQNMTRDQVKYCEAIMRNLKKHRDAAPFLQPVDYKRLNIPDYPRIIQQPMDLSTIDKKLTSGSYVHVDDWICDVRLLFNNCFKFNGPEATVSMLCQNVENAFEKSLRQMPSLELEKKEKSPERQVEGARKDEQLRFCHQTLKELKKNKYRDINFAFLQPVDVVALNIPDYVEIVKRPMDLSTIEKKLSRNDYAEPEEFEEDMRLMFNNCYLYNPPSLPIYKIAQQLEKVFEDKWAQRPSKVDPVLENLHQEEFDDSEDERDKKIAELERHIATLSQQIALIKSQKRKKPERPRRATKEKKQTKRKPNKKKESKVEFAEFTFDQKKDLSERINNLTGDGLNTVVSIIQSSMPNLDGQGQEEIVLDIDSLDRSTLHRLHEFVTGQNLTKRKTNPPRKKQRVKNQKTLHSDSSSESGESDSSSSGSDSDSASSSD